jgi:hypothetical protein
VSSLSRVVFDPDTTAPGIPSGVAASAQSQTTIRVTWSASSDTGGSGLAGYKVYRSNTSGGTYLLLETLSTASLAYDDTTLTAGTTRFYRVSAFDGNSNESAQSSAVNATTTGAGWQSFTGPTFARGTAGSFSFNEFAPGGSTAYIIGTSGQTGVPNTAKIAELAAQGITLDSANGDLDYDGTGSGSASITGVIIENVTTAEQDWLLRSGQDPSNPQTGVVWFHDFRSDAEVNQFRWCAGYGGGQNPVLTGSAAGEIPFPGNTRRITTDGIPGAGSGVLEIVAHDGGVSNPTADTAEWWRPFSPLNAPGNGRATNDPAANGTLTRRTWSVSNQSSTMAGFDQGWYGHTDYHGGGQFDGTEYYLQVRVKIDTNRDASDNDAGGKLFYFTRNDRSLTDQEIVTESKDLSTNSNFFSMYRSGGNGLESDSPGIATHGDQPGIEGGTVGNGVCRFDNNGGRAANCFRLTRGVWWTLEYHVRPGHDSANDTLVEVWAQETPGGTVRRVWNQTGVDLPFDGSHPFGINSLICSGYMNRFGGNRINTQFYHRWTQLIFSKSFIPFPTV